MNKDELSKMKDKIAKERIETQKEIDRNPLSQYTTTQLKKELRRRKKEGWQGCNQCTK